MLASPGCCNYNYGRCGMAMSRGFELSCSSLTVNIIIVILPYRCHRLFRTFLWTLNFVFHAVCLHFLDFSLSLCSRTEPCYVDELFLIPFSRRHLNTYKVYKTKASAPLKLQYILARKLVIYTHGCDGCKLELPLLNLFSKLLPHECEWTDFYSGKRVLARHARININPIIQRRLLKSINSILTYLMPNRNFVSA